MDAWQGRCQVRLEIQIVQLRKKKHFMKHGNVTAAFLGQPRIP